MKYEENAAMPIFPYFAALHMGYETATAHACHTSELASGSDLQVINLFFKI